MYFRTDQVKPGNRPRIRAVDTLVTGLNQPEPHPPTAQQAGVDHGHRTLSELLYDQETQY